MLSVGGEFGVESRVVDVKLSPYFVICEEFFQLLQLIVREHSSAGSDDQFDITPNCHAQADSIGFLEGLDRDAQHRTPAGRQRRRGRRLRRFFRSPFAQRDRDFKRLVATPNPKPQLASGQ